MFYPQALTKIHLWGNEIGALGAQYLAEALKYNTVNFHAIIKNDMLPSLLFTQTLTTLDFECNRFGPVGAQHLADALQQNTVNFISSSTILFYRIHFSHRHSQTSTSKTVTLEIQAHNISLKL